MKISEYKSYDDLPLFLNAGLEHIRFHDLRHPNVKPKTNIFTVKTRSINKKKLMLRVLV